MPTAVEIKNRLETVFERAQARVLTDVMVSSYEELVKTGDFNELKGIVRELAQTQNRTEIKVERLVEAQNRLTEAQNRTEGEIQKLTKGLRETRGELGGLSRSVGYAFENEAYRMLPEVLRNTYEIELKERLIRTEMGGKEINILGRAKRNGEDVLIMGEARLRLDERRGKARDVFKELEEKVLAVKEEYKEEEVVRVLITHYATKGFMKKAKDKGVIVVQSFQW